MIINKHLFGYTKDGEQVDCYKLEENHFVTEILTYGGIIRSLVVPINGSKRDVALGFDNIADYEAQNSYIGALIGRVANRIGRARFSLNTTNYTVDANDGQNCLHGGYRGFDRRIWNARAQEGGLILSLHSPALECGFPGNLDVEVCYRLENSALSIEYTASCDEDTPLSLTSHCYFNLGGHDSGSIENHSIQIFAQAVTAADTMQITTGDLLDVADTPFDLREPKTISSGLAEGHPQIIIGDGYDINYVLSYAPCRNIAPAAILEYDGLSMTCHTTQPGIHFYSGNHLPDLRGKDAAVYAKRSGVCLETQSWPNAVNHPGFPDCILKKGDTYRHKTVFSFNHTV